MHCHRLLRFALLPLPLSLLPAAAFAHGGHGDGFAVGFTHPFSGVDHLLAMLAVGWWSAYAATQRWWLVPLGFATGTLLGALVATSAAWVLPGVEVAIAMALLLLGVLLSARVVLPLACAVSLVAILGGLHGLAHGQALSQGGAVGTGLAGMVAATLVLHIAGALIGRSTRRRSVWLPGLGGAAVAGAGACLLAALVLS